MIATLTHLARRTRQHHAIEHAALHLLARRAPGRRLLGLSDPLGFTIFGRLEQAQVQKAVSDAMLRLQAGENKLAIHPNCGTNLAVSGFAAASAAALARVGARGPAQQFLRTALFILPALVLAQPLGLRLQEYTTCAEIADRWMVGVRTLHAGPVTISRVVLE